MSANGQSGRAHLVEEEESYFVSMTDMMVGIIFVFIILLMTFALSFREAEEVRKDKIEQLEAVEEAKEVILEDIRKSLENVGIKVEIDIENGILHLPEEILFPSGTARLNEQGRESLGHLARALFSVVPCYSKYEAGQAPASCPPDTLAKLDAIFIEGHTDDVPVGRDNPFDDNWDLSAQRAIATYKQLQQLEPRLDLLKNSRSEQLFSVSGYGKFRPYKDNSTENGRRANRRIDLRFLMKTPRSTDLKMAEEALNQVGVEQ